MTDPKLDEARDLLDRGAFKEGLELVDGLEGFEATHLAAFALLGLGELDAALTMCRRAPPLSRPAPTENPHTNATTPSRNDS